MNNLIAPWLYNQLVEHKIIVVDKTTYGDKVTAKYQILFEQASEMEIMGKEMSYSDGYREGYKRALELIEWYIKNINKEKDI
jgi:hypothetical protein